MKKQVKTDATQLPPDVTAEDLEYAPFGSERDFDAIRAIRTKLVEAGAEELTYGSLQFYKTEGFGWVLTTLKISNGKRGRDDRYYAVGMSGEVYRVGNGPHVTKVVNVYLSPANAERLWKYVELWLKGAASAGKIRDRISSRRAQGQEMRAQGRSFWTWDAK